ncbi:MAG: type I DNA topoisomerase [Anaerolineales bacterium]|nr:type I DNA topoisomerase [Anaerolineales bacterium]
MKAYCVKCKEKHEMESATAVFTATGTPGTRGTCSVCGTNMFRMGKTTAHEGLVAPENTKRKTKKEKPRKGKLVIVESPAKARTINRYLGKEYKVVASVGHVRDLLKSKLSVDIENNFEPSYRVPNDKRSVVKEIKQLGQEAEEIYLATDLDREGEAIAWHLLEAAELDPERTRRVIFQEITRSAIEEAFSNPAVLDMNLVNAQQGRRIVDRLVGFQISPILWEKVRGGLTAGRVQSVALRLIVDREREIEAFIPVEYWSIDAELYPEGTGQDNNSYIANLTHLDGKKIQIGSNESLEPILKDLETARYEVRKIRRGTRVRNPYPPFITSTLQQDASRQMNFSAKKTMAVAQQLYQGIDVGNGEETGLITYMRTDSTNISDGAQQAARKFIQDKYGDAYVPSEIPHYATKAKRAQEAHEAIRPTSVSRTPKALKGFLKKDQYRLYKLIWQRFVASQMASAEYDTLSVIIGADGSEHVYVLRASGSKIKFPGFLQVYDRNNGKATKAEKDLERIPDNLLEGQAQELIKLLPEQHFTQPPPRFSEASLVSTLEENGIGRPSTYAPIMGKLIKRGYVVKDSRRLNPTETGFIVNDLVSEYFSSIVDVGFTAQMEKELDQVASGEDQWQDTVKDFYGPFSEQLDFAKREMPKIEPVYIHIGRSCPECGHDLVQRWGRYGLYIGCSDKPNCSHTERWVEKIGVICPNDGGELIERRTRKGRTFYGCDNYPECDFASWKKPLPDPCPSCEGLLVTTNKNHAQCTVCNLEFKLDEIKKVSE